jgi:hypothetical protein
MGRVRGRKYGCCRGRYQVSALIPVLFMDGDKKDMTKVPVSPGDGEDVGF